MRYGQIRKYDVANGPGIRVSVFVTGCPIKCVLGVLMKNINRKNRG